MSGLNEPNGLKFSGRVTKKLRTRHYRLNYFDGDRTHTIPLCYSLMHSQLGIKHTSGFILNSDSYAWGYSGQAPLITTAVILGIYGNLHARGSGTSLPAASNHLIRAHSGPILGIKFVQKHYQQFAEEVIAKLPDNWTLTFKEIDEWVQRHAKG